MISNIIVNIVLAANCFFYMLKFIPAEEISYNWGVSMRVVAICISIGMYILSNLGYFNRFRGRMIFANTVYLLVVSCIFPHMIVLITPAAIETMINREQSHSTIFTALVAILLIQVQLGVDNILISLSGISAMYIYMNLKSKIRKENLERINYELREKMYSMEESRVLENKLSYQSIETTKMEERNAISQKLHDKIGHVIAGSLMQLEALKIVMSSDPKVGSEMLDKIADNLREGMDDIRYTLRKIKPEQSEMGINNLKLFLDDFSRDSKIDCELSIEGDLGEINIIYWKIILDSLKEILTNVIKYSNCDRLNIDLSVLNKIIRVHIKDNGVCTGDIKKGMGLLGIEERVINVGGNVVFDNEDGFSTLIILKR